MIGKNSHRMPGTVTGYRAYAHKCGVLVDGNPYGTAVDLRHVILMDDQGGLSKKQPGIDTKGRSIPYPAKEGSTVVDTSTMSLKELRKRAAKLGIEELENYKKDELAAVVASSEEEEGDAAMPAATKDKKAKLAAKKKKAAAKAGNNGAGNKKAAAKAAKGEKKVRKAREPRVVDPSAPYRAGTNQARIVDELKKGGTREQLAERLKGKLEFNFYRTGDTSEEYLAGAVKHRIMVVIKNLRNLGWDIEENEKGKLTAVPPA